MVAAGPIRHRRRVPIRPPRRAPLPHPRPRVRLPRDRIRRPASPATTTPISSVRSVAASAIVVAAVRAKPTASRAPRAFPHRWDRPACLELLQRARRRRLHRPQLHHLPRHRLPRRRHQPRTTRSHKRAIAAYRRRTRIAPRRASRPSRDEAIARSAETSRPKPTRSLHSLTASSGNAARAHKTNAPAGKERRRAPSIPASRRCSTKDRAPALRTATTTT